MRWLIALLILLVLSVLAAQFVREEPGYVMIAYQGWTVEMTFTLMIAALVLAVAVVYVVISIVTGFLRLPGWLGTWQKNRRSRKAESTLNKGMVMLFERQWHDAEKILVKKGKSSRMPLLNYLGAARAAQAQGAFDRRDEYLKLAHESNPGAQTAIGLTQSELLIEQGHYEQALATLARLRQDAPRHPHVLQLLAEVYAKLKEWEPLEDLLQDLRRHKAMSEERLEALTSLCYFNLLDTYVERHDMATLQRLWQRMPRGLRRQPALVGHYAQILMHQNGHEQAEAVLRAAIDEEWNAELVHMYGRVQADNVQGQLEQAERWQHLHPTDPALLLALGRLARRCELWGKARGYLEAAVRGNRAEAYQELATLLERMGEPEAALQYYRQGLMMAGSQEALPRP